jgi:hypothetical protein
VGDVAATTWVTYRQALRLFVRGVTMRSAARITLVVGTWLSVMNQGGQILDGRLPWVKVFLNYLTPFAVSSLGFLAASRQRSGVGGLDSLE